MRKHLFLAVMILGLALSLAPAGTPATTVEAQEPSHVVYLPLAEYRPRTHGWDFATDPGWKSAILKENEVRDGYFEQVAATETYQAHVTDNSALIAAWSDWRVSGDYMIEVDARHVSPNRKSFNGLGLVFNLELNENEPWHHQFHALMLAAGGAQHAWAVTRFEDTRVTYLTNDGYRGGTNFMNAWNNWNQLEIRVVNGVITAWCNNKWLPDGIVPAHEANLIDGRRVGVVVTSYEFDNGEMEFDNFRITRLFPSDPEYQEALARISAQAAQDEE